MSRPRSLFARGRIFVFLLATSAPWLAACSGNATDAEAALAAGRGPVVARVGQEPIYRADVLRARARQRLTDGPEAELAPGGPRPAHVPPAVLDPAQERVLRQTVLQNLVEQALLLGAAKRGHVTALADEVDSAWAQLTSGWRDEALGRALVAMDVTVPELKAQLRQALVASKVLRAEALDRVCVLDADIDAYVAAHPEELLAPEQLRLRQIVVQDQDQVRQVQEAIKKKASFADTAARLSLAPEASAGGDLGLFRREDLPQQMAQVCFALKPRTLSAPIEASDGYHLFWVSEKLPAHKRTLNEVRPRIERRLRAEAESRAAADYISQLQEKTHVQTFAENWPEN